MDVLIPDKLYFKIGEVAQLTGVKPHVLRYWEAEFRSIRPAKSRTQQRLFRRQDIELILRLKDLLYNQGFTIAGAKRQLREPGFSGRQADAPLGLVGEPDDHRLLLQEVRRDLLRLRSLLDPSR